MLARDVEATARIDAEEQQKKTVFKMEKEQPARKEVEVIVFEAQKQSQIAETLE